MANQKCRPDGMGGYVKLYINLLIYESYTASSTEKDYLEKKRPALIGHEISHALTDRATHRACCRQTEPQSIPALTAFCHELI